MTLNLVFAVLGTLFLMLGLWLLFPPLMFIVAGIGLLVLGLLREVPDGEAGRSTDQA